MSKNYVIGNIHKPISTIVSDNIIDWSKGPTYESTAIPIGAQLDPDIFNQISLSLNVNFSVNAKDCNVVKSMVIQNVNGEEKILVAGNFINHNNVTGRNCLIRLNNDGTIDETFCQSAVDNKLNDWRIFERVILQPNGKILLAGFNTSLNKSWLFRFNEDLTIDNTFSNNISLNNIQNYGNINVDDTPFYDINHIAIAVQSDNKILVNCNDGNKIVRLNENGTLDSTFLAGGIILSDNVKCITTDSSNRIYVGGSFINTIFTGKNALARFNSNGTLDSTWNSPFASYQYPVITSICIQPDGKVIYGGYEARYSLYPVLFGVLNSNGTLNRQMLNHDYYPPWRFFEPGSALRAILLQSDGKILVGGIDEFGIPFMLRINTNDTYDTNFNNTYNRNHLTPNFGSCTGFYCMVVKSDGKVIGGGSINYIYNPGLNQKELLGLMEIGEDLAYGTFHTNAVDQSKFNGTIYTIVPQQINNETKILIGGSFTNYGGAAGRNYLVRLNNDGTVDTGFCSSIVDNGRFNAPIRSIVVDSSNNIYIGGDFTDYGAANRNKLIKISSSNSLDATFCSAAIDGGKFNNSVHAIAIQSNTGNIVVGGDFTNYNAIMNLNRLLMFSSSGAIDVAYSNAFSSNNKFNNIVRSISMQNTGIHVVAGDFTNYNSHAERNFLVRLKPDYTIDESFCQKACDYGRFKDAIYTTVIQSDGKILVGGKFKDYDYYDKRDHLIRLNSDGTVDSMFCNYAVDGSKFNNDVLKISLDSTHKKILVGGSFNNSNYSYFLKLSSSGVIDTTFHKSVIDTAVNGPVYAINIQSDNKLLIGGDFTDYNSVLKRDKLIRLKPLSNNLNILLNNDTDGRRIFFKLTNTANTAIDLTWPDSIVNPDASIAASTSKLYSLIKIKNDIFLDTKIL